MAYIKTFTPISLDGAQPSALSFAGIQGTYRAKWAEQESIMLQGWIKTEGQRNYDEEDDLLFHQHGPIAYKKVEEVAEKKSESIQVKTDAMETQPPSQNTQVHHDAAFKIQKAWKKSRKH